MPYKVMGERPNRKRCRTREALDEAEVQVREPAYVNRVLRNPLAFLWDPLAPEFAAPLRDLRAAHRFLSEPRESRYVYGICTRFIRKACPAVESALKARKLTVSDGCRYWPFWHAHDLKPSESRSIRTVARYLEALWNEDAMEPACVVRGERFPTQKPLMLESAGPLSVVGSFKTGRVIVLKCTFPIPPTVCAARNGSADAYPGFVVFVFDQRTKGFYTLNARIRSDELPRHRYVEIIQPDLRPPDLLAHTPTKRGKAIKVAVILDRHIGESLSLFATYIPALVYRPNTEVTIDASRCHLLSQMSPARMHSLIGRHTRLVPEQPDYKDFDIVFDPYDNVPGLFPLKPQNDTAAVTFVSALELAIASSARKRRGVLDAHRESIKRFGLLLPGQYVSEFAHIHLSLSERKTIRARQRRALARIFGTGPRQAFVSIFPFGSVEERKYPLSGLRTIILELLVSTRAHVIVCGSAFDTPDLVASIPVERQMTGETSSRRVIWLKEQSLEDVLAIMLASDVVVAMDSGPLHVGRALRIKPLALYSRRPGVYRIASQNMWHVGDGTIERLEPTTAHPHVAPGLVVAAIRRRLRVGARG